MAKPAPSTGILVLGMHRSGTSAIARVLNLLGAEIGQHLIAGEKGINDRGYWEDAEIVDLHEKFLRWNDRSWHDIRELPKDSLLTPSARQVSEQIATKLQHEFAGASLWLVKDPRLSRLAPLWAEALAAQGSTPVFVLAIRHPLEVVASLVKRDGMPRAQALLLWARYVLDAMTVSAGQRRAVSDFDDLLRDWRGQAQRIALALQLHWPRNEDAAASDVSEFLSEGERRHRVDNSAPSDEPLVGQAIGLYLALRAISEGKGRWLDAELRAEQLRAAFNEAAPLVAEVLEHAWLHAERADRWQRLLDVERAALKDSGGMSAIQARIAELEAHIAEQYRCNGDLARQLDAAVIRADEATVRADEAIVRADEAIVRADEAEKGRLSALAQAEQNQANEAMLRNDLAQAKEQAKAAMQEAAKNSEVHRAAQLAADRLAAQLLEMEHSTSWRMTAPMRALRRTLSLAAALAVVKALLLPLRAIYHRLPLSYPTRLRLRGLYLRVRHPKLGVAMADGLWREATRLSARRDQHGSDLHDSGYAPIRVAEVAGSQAGSYIAQILATPRAPGDEHVAYIDPPRPEKTLARAIAFYLPQFHPIAENDEWWGRGFTEWTNVGKAVPQFIGHYQPRLPGELGYYDLRVVDVMRRQIELARQYGVEGFCFHYYWFDGRRLLERPLQQFLQDPTLDFPFCICWANENWTRRWDGQDSEVLMAQKHSPESDERFIRDLLPLLRDPRYIRVDGRPLVVLYRPSILPDARATLLRWREICRAEGVGELFLAMAQFDVNDPREYGFDAAIEFPPHKLARDLTLRNSELELVNQNYAGHVVDYGELVDTAVDWPEPDYPMIRGLSPSWDNEARKPGKGYTFIGSTPALYRYWLQESISYARRHPVAGESLVFINAWNEWGEGAYLEPDRRYGYAYLQATRDALSADPVSSISPGQRIVVVAHDAHPHGAQYLSLNLCRQLRELGFVVDAVLLGGGELQEAFERVATVHLLGCRGGDSKGRALARALAKGGARQAIANSAVCGQFCADLAAVGIRVVSLVHELPGVVRDLKLQPCLEAIARHAQAVVFAAEPVRAGFAEFAALPEAQAVIRPQGLYKRNRFRGEHGRAQARPQLREILGLPADARIVLAVGYADLRKGVDLFVEAAAPIVAADRRHHLVWLGHFDLAIEAKIRARVAELGLQQHVHFPGRSDHTDLFYAGADVLLLSSREDPYPSVVMESLEVGVPVLAFRASGGATALLKRGCGLLVDTVSAPALAEACLRLLNDPAKAQALGACGEAIIAAEYGFRAYVFDLLALVGVVLPRVSVVVPNYNYAHYLPQRLQSILDQTLPVYEIIILDDASTDDSREVLEGMAADHGVRLVFNASNSGSVFRQWQQGVELARGEFVWIAEADDLSYPGFLEHVLHPLRDSTVVMSYSQSEQIGAEAEHLAPDYRAYTDDINRERWLHAFVAELADELAAGFAVKNTIPNVSAVVFRRDALQSALRDGLAEIASFRIAGDWATYLRVLTRGKLAFCAEPLNRHRRHSGGVTLGGKAEQHLLEVLRMQHMVQSRHVVPTDQQVLAQRYAERLYREFGLAAGSLASLQELQRQASADVSRKSEHVSP